MPLFASQLCLDYCLIRKSAQPEHPRQHGSAQYALVVELKPETMALNIRRIVESEHVLQVRLGLMLSARLVQRVTHESIGNRNVGQIAGAMGSPGKSLGDRSRRLKFSGVQLNGP